MAEAPDERPKLPPRVPPASPVRVLRARRSVKTLRETAWVRGAIAVAALAAGAFWLWVELVYLPTVSPYRSTFRQVRGCVFAVIVSILGLREAWLAVSMWREARRRPPAS